MKLPLTISAAVVLLTACSPIGVSASFPTGASLQAIDAASLGGLTNSLAAHPSVQLAKPKAFALAPEAKPFLEALSRTVEPMRVRLAERLLTDPAVTQGLARWERATAADQPATLNVVAAIEGEVMGCLVPPIVAQTGRAAQAGTMAYYLPGTDDIGQVVLYPDVMAHGGKYLALATLVHEIRHAAQYQLMQAGDRNQGAAAEDTVTLVNAYEETWKAITALGGESAIAYGDYVHLNIEYDAFQTGNQVAAIVSKGTFDALGNGFIDTQYTANAKPVLSLLDLAETLSGTTLIVAVNQAQFKAENQRGGTVSRQRHQGFKAPVRRRR
ncbi:MAG: hypothetical protein H7338_12625 [Candidatus Sericytochromatia bacterium]|nr:hypothetical protein [Candidatus Sericytochromatia bacterium]